MARTRTTVEEILNGLDPDRRAQVDALRELLLARPGVVEGVKWNAPSYALDGEDRATFALRNREGHVQLVLHMGTARAEDRTAPPVLADPAGIVEWRSDIRGVLTFRDAADVVAKRTAVADVVERWLAIPVHGG